MQLFRSRGRTQSPDNAGSEDVDGGNNGSGVGEVQLVSPTPEGEGLVYEEESDDDSTETVVDEDYARRLLSSRQGGSALWPGLVEDEEGAEERRRAVIRAELERSQRSSFIHFMVLLLVPTCLLLIIFVNSLTEDNECESNEWTTCENESRSFINAFTTRCVCRAVPLPIDESEDL